MPLNSLEPLSTVRINGDTWKVYLLTRTQIKQLHDDEPMGITAFDHSKGKFVMAFKKPKVSYNTVRHEVMHAYLSYHSFDGLNKNEIEEIVCEVIGAKLNQIAKTSELIYKALLGIPKK